MIFSANDVWQKVLADIFCNGWDVHPREGGHGAGKTLELLNYSSRIDMQYPVITIPERKLSHAFMQAEAYWILSGDNRVETIAPHAPSIAKFSDDGETFFGAYGPRIDEQIMYVINTLVRDPQSRQAVMTIWRQNPPKSKDIPCTVAVQWFIRNGRLHCVDTMRSSDVWLGWPYDVFNFSALSFMLLLYLRSRHDMDLRLGSLWLNAGSQHLYDRNIDKARVCMRAPQPRATSMPFHHERFQHPEDFLEALKTGSLI